MLNALSKIIDYYYRFIKAVSMVIYKRVAILEKANGLELLLDPKDEITDTICEGSYENDVVWFLNKYLKPGHIVFDIGAHAGYFTLIMAWLVGASGQVHSFEPSPHMFRWLSRNVKRNNFSQVILNKKAISNKVGKEALNTYYNERSAYATFGIPPHPNSKVTKVKTETIDHYIQEQGLHRVDFIKMDIEGAETWAIEGGYQLFSYKDAPPLICEFSDRRLKSCGSNTKRLWEMLEFFGYNFYHVNGQKISKEVRRDEYHYSNLIAMKDSTYVSFF